MTRVYIPATRPLLATLHRTGRAALGVDLIDEVVVAPDDAEETEYDALMTAAQTSAGLARDLGPGHRRRVVIVAEVTSVGDSVDLSDVVAVHADPDDVPLDRDPDELDDLGWYATQEIPDLLL